MILDGKSVIYLNKRMIMASLALLLFFSFTFTACKIQYTKDESTLNSTESDTTNYSEISEMTSEVSIASNGAETSAKSTSAEKTGTPPVSSVASSRARPTTSQSSSETKPENPYYRSMNAGSGKTFTGSCLFINIFLSDGVSSFTEEERQKVKEKLLNAESFIKQQATNYNKHISMIYNKEDLYIDYNTNYTVPTDYDYSNWFDLNSIVQEIKSRYSIENIIKKYQAENVAYIIHVNKIGRSYAFWSYYYSDPIYNDELCILFTSEYNRENNLSEVVVATFTHEILHFFGAIDLYNLNDDLLMLAEKYFSDDVMLIEWNDINLCKIGELTAFLIGWTDHLDEKYKIFLDTT